MIPPQEEGAEEEKDRTELEIATIGKLRAAGGDESFDLGVLVGAAALRAGLPADMFWPGAALARLQGR